MTNVKISSIDYHCDACATKLHAAVRSVMWAAELTTRFGWDSVRLIRRDLGHCPRWWSHLGQWARSRGINPDSHTKRVDNSGSATTVLATKYLYNDAKCLFLSERWVLFSKVSAIFVILITWHKQTNQHQENGTTALPAGCSPCKNVLLGLLSCQHGVVPWDYVLVLAGHPPS